MYIYIYSMQNACNTQMKAKEKDKIIEQMEDDKRDLVAKLEAITKETEKAKQALESEHQKTLEQMNVRFMCLKFAHRDISST